MSASDELRFADVSAAGMNRGLNVEPIRWTELLSIAQRELNAFQSRLQLRRASDLYDEELATPLIAAARILLEVATRRSQEGDQAALVSPSLPGLNTGEHHLQLVLASCAFGMYGNFPSSAAVQRLMDFSLVQSEGQWLALVLCNPSLLGRALNSAAITDSGREFLERLNMFLHTGDEVEETQLVSHFEELMAVSRPLSEVTFLRSARLALQHCINLAIARLRRTATNDYLEPYLKGILADRRYCLLPPQYNVIADGFLESEANAIVTLPTSTGKTLLAELAIASRLKRDGDIALFVAPYVALGRQVYDCFKQHAPPEIEVRGYFGTFNSHMDNLSTTRSTVIVATPERVDAILRSHDLYGRLSTVVFDEAHGVENGVRGVRLESLIARLRLQQKRGRPFRMILLSAVLAQVDALREWLGTDARHFEDSWRPTTRRLAIWTSDGKLGWLYGSDPLRPSSKEGSSFLGRKPLEWPAAMWPASQFGAIKAQLPSAFENVSFLARYAQKTIGGPVLVACFAKQTTRGVAQALSHGMQERETESPDLDRLLTCLKKYPHLSSLGLMARKGVAYHNASLPSDVKVCIEKAVKSRSIEYVASTTTLAEGVDLPFRCTIIFDWLVGFGENQSPMDALLFRNIAGRCGRAGEFTEGDTIIFDNVLGAAHLVADRSRAAAQASLFSDPHPLRSAIANENNPDDVKDAIRSVLSSQLLAAIPENPLDPSVEASLSKALYAAQHNDPPLEMFEDIRAELLSTEHGQPFALAASPMWLTPLGEAANRTGFGPRTCRKLLEFLGSIESSLEPHTLAERLLLAFGNSEEQSNYILREVTSGRRSSKLFVKNADLSMLATGWLNGIPLTDLFVLLPKAAQSKAAVPPARWAAGDAESEFVAGQYDKFIELMGYAFGGFLPWVMRACETLQSVALQTRICDWATLAEMFEEGGPPDEESNERTLDRVTVGLSAQ